MAHLGFGQAVRGCSLALIAVAIGLPTAGVAQQEQQGDAPPWVKICATDPGTKKEFCLVSQEIYADTGQFIVSATIRETVADKKLTFIVAVPPGMLLQSGLRAQIDEGKQQEVKYSVCFPNACYADVAIGPEFVESMKAGGQLIITTRSHQGQNISFPLTLVGFTKIYDSEGIDPVAGRAKLEDLSKSLKAHAEEARQKLIEQQQKTGN